MHSKGEFPVMYAISGGDSIQKFSSSHCLHWVFRCEVPLHATSSFFLSVLLVQMTPELLQRRPPEISTGWTVTSRPSLADSLHFTDAGLTSRVFVKCRDKDDEVFQQGYRLTLSLVEAEGRRTFSCFFYLGVVGWKWGDSQVTSEPKFLLFAVQHTYRGGYCPR